MFDFFVTTAANTAKANPTRTDIELEPGVIDLVHIDFPPGPQGLLHVKIERGGSLLWPRNEGEGFAWDNRLIAFSPFYALSEEPLDLAAVTWNDDDTFPHSVSIRINVIPKDLAFSDRQELSILQRMERSLFRRRG